MTAFFPPIITEQVLEASPSPKVSPGSSLTELTSPGKQSYWLPECKSTELSEALRDYLANAQLGIEICIVY